MAKNFSFKFFFKTGQKASEGIEGIVYVENTGLFSQLYQKHSGHNM